MLKSTRFAAVCIVLLSLTTACSLSKQSDNASKMALASHLKQIGAKMYGTNWCIACNGQKKAFGEKALSHITYIECDPGGKDAKPDLCRQLNITSFPTWEIKGKFYCQGGCSLEKLAEVSGYKGDRKALLR